MFNRPTLKITNKMAICKFANDSNREIEVEMKVPPASTIERFNLLIYNNAYKTQLIGNWRVEVHSLSG